MHTHYCDVRCQKKDFRFHRKQCLAIKVYRNNALKAPEFVEKILESDNDLNLASCRARDIVPFTAFFRNLNKVIFKVMMPILKENRFEKLMQHFMFMSSDDLKIQKNQEKLFKLMKKSKK